MSEHPGFVDLEVKYSVISVVASWKPPDLRALGLFLWLVSNLPHKMKRASQMVQQQSICLPMQETRKTQVQSLGQEDLLEKGVATHSSILIWRIPWTEEPGMLQSTGSQRVGSN